ncbi:hypothetical protein AAC387_Pa01g0503 [Persea americana]
MVVRKERFAMCGERVPAIERDVRFKTLTRWCLRLHVTPRHLQKWSELFHELTVWNGSSVISALKASSASRSVSFCGGVAVAVSEKEMRRMEWMKNDQNTQQAMGERSCIAWFHGAPIQSYTLSWNG